MDKIEKNILEQVKNHTRGLLSPADMINGIARKNTKAVERLIIYGYLEKVPEYKPGPNGMQKYLFYRITEKGLNVFSPFYKKIWFMFKGDIRTIIVSVITAIITTLLMKFLL